MSTRALGTVVVLGSLLLSACGQPPEPVQRVQRAGDLPQRVSAAMREEQRGDADKAARAWLDVVRSASRDDGPWALPAAGAALEALVWRKIGRAHV